MGNLEVWEKVARPPKEALKQIKGGRLSGMTDISPQWRYKVMTDVFGPCGVGWKYEIIRLWMELGVDGQVMAFSEIKLYTHTEDGWSSPVPGIGGSAFIAKESGGLRASDECYKMATTDALSVAMKMLGVGADIYAGSWDGSKYKDDKGTSSQSSPQTKPPYAPTPENRTSVTTDTPSGNSNMGYDEYTKALDVACQMGGSAGMAKWAVENKSGLEKIGYAELSKFRKYYAELLASTKEIEAKPATVSCPLGGEKTAVDCAECGDKEKCEHGRVK